MKVIRNQYTNLCNICHEEIVFSGSVSRLPLYVSIPRVDVDICPRCATVILQEIVQSEEKTYQEATEKILKEIPEFQNKVKSEKM